MKPGEFNIEEQAEDGRYTLALRGELDLACAPSLLERIVRLCAEGAIDLTLDLRALTFIDSTGLSTLLSARKICEEGLSNFWLIPGPARVQRVFELAGVSTMLPFRESTSATAASVPGE